MFFMTDSFQQRATPKVTFRNCPSNKFVSAINASKNSLQNKCKKYSCG